MGKIIKKRSALNPILWLCGVISLPAMIIIAIFENECPGWFAYLVIVPVCLALLAYVYLLVVDREKLVTKVEKGEEAA